MCTCIESYEVNTDCEDHVDCDECGEIKNRNDITHMNYPDMYLCPKCEDEMGFKYCDNCHVHYLGNGCPECTFYWRVPGFLFII